MNQTQCHTCTGHANRLQLADNLNAAEAAGLEAPDQYGDMRQGDSYTVTGVAANLVPGRIWIRARGAWHWHHAEHAPEGEEIKSLKLNSDGEADMDEEAYSRLVNRWGEGHQGTMPEAVACWLGIEHDVNPMYAHCETGQYANRDLDTLTFAQAAVELRQRSDLLGPCTCGEDEDHQ